MPGRASSSSLLAVLMSSKSDFALLAMAELADLEPLEGCEVVVLWAMLVVVARKIRTTAIRRCETNLLPMVPPRSCCFCFLVRRAEPARTSRIDSALSNGISHAIDRQHVGRNAVVDAVCLG